MAKAPLCLSQQVSGKTFLLPGGRCFPVSKSFLEPPMIPGLITQDSLRALSLRAPLLLDNHKDIWKYNANIASYYFDELKDYNLTNEDREKSIALLVKLKVFPFDQGEVETNVRWDYVDGQLQCENRFITGCFQFLLARDLFYVRKDSVRPVRSEQDRASGILYLALLNKKVIRNFLRIFQVIDAMTDNTLVWTCPETGDAVIADNLLAFPHGYPWDEQKDQKVLAIDTICDHMDLPRLGTISKVRFLEWVSLIKEIPSSLEIPDCIFTIDEDLSESMVSDDSFESINTSREMEILEREIRQLDRPQTHETHEDELVSGRTYVCTLTSVERSKFKTVVQSLKDQIRTLLSVSKSGVCTFNRRYLRYCIHTLITNFNPNVGFGFKGPWTKRLVGRTDPQSYHRHNRDLKSLKSLIGSVSRLKTAVA
jgi:hypothetical protein